MGKRKEPRAYKRRKRKFYGNRFTNNAPLTDFNADSEGEGGRGQATTTEPSSASPSTSTTQHTSTTASSARFELKQDFVCDNEEELSGLVIWTANFLSILFLTSALNARIHLGKTTNCPVWKRWGVLDLCVQHSFSAVSVDTVSLWILPRNVRNIWSKQKICCCIGLVRLKCDEVSPERFFLHETWIFTWHQKRFKSLAFFTMSQHRYHAIIFLFLDWKLCVYDQYINAVEKAVAMKNMSLAMSIQVQHILPN